MKNKKITSSAVPKNSYDLVNKLYVDGLMVHIQTKSPHEINSYPFKDTELEKMHMYYNIAITHKPKFWLSSKFPSGLFPKLNKVFTIFSLSDIMRNKVVMDIMPVVNPIDDTIYAQNITYDSELSVFTLNQTSRMTINFDFKIDYTFIFVLEK